MRNSAALVLRVEEACGDSTERLDLTFLHFPFSNFIPQPIGKCRRVFQALLPYAVEELCNVAESLIVPVRMGIARPTAPFTLASTSIDAVQGSEELFSVEPLPPRPSPDQSSRSAGFTASYYSDKSAFIIYLSEKLMLIFQSGRKNVSHSRSSQKGKADCWFFFSSI